MLEAASNGTAVGLLIIGNIVANLIGFLAFLAFLNSLLTWFGEIVLLDFISFEVSCAPPILEIFREIAHSAKASHASLTSFLGLLVAVSYNKIVHVKYFAFLKSSADVISVSDFCLIPA